MDGMVQVQNRILKADMYYKNSLVLQYKIQHPWFESIPFFQSVIRMNQYYTAKSADYQQYCRQELYLSAAEQYDYSVKNNFPVRVFEAVQNYTITYNQDCAVSLYFDKYQYTGGAHGSTIRYSDTWNLKSGVRIMLKQLFSSAIPYRTYIINAINHQIAAQISQGDNIYFDDYEKSVVNYFNPDSYYLTEEGIVIYFQQYEIAPYASGLPEFKIPYLIGAVTQPYCC
ncbi:MAG: DUF3298 and DUF4163 domain-containing protein [Christensenellales bacterium]|jgi:hypothetical protein